MILIFCIRSYPRLQNCVATVDLDTKLNLREIVQSVHNAECVCLFFIVN
jgi:TATA-box binding protein (TBP) (component of TFIID and TFIIIB)